MLLSDDHSSVGHFKLMATELNTMSVSLKPAPRHLLYKEAQALVVGDTPGFI